MGVTATVFFLFFQKKKKKKKKLFNVLFVKPVRFIAHIMSQETNLKKIVTLFSSDFFFSFFPLCHRFSLFV
jgi:hypothetical protein